MRCDTRGNLKKKALLILAASAATALIAFELPEIVRYLKMTRL